MKVFGIVGWKNNGKTTLVTRLVEDLTARGLAVSTVKHAHHEFDIDQPGKDSHRHRMAGAQEVLVTSARRWALIHELRDRPEPGLEELLEKMAPVDLVLVEGFKRHVHPKIEVSLKETGTPLIALEDTTILAVATNDPALVAPVPRLDIDDAGAVADFILAQAGLEGTA
jgi:molybdopterin-guanine dinucleotide biosynthesis protein MobB